MFSIVFKKILERQIQEKSVHWEPSRSTQKARQYKAKSRFQILKTGPQTKAKKKLTLDSLQ